MKWEELVDLNMIVDDKSPLHSLTQRAWLSRGLVPYQPHAAVAHLGGLTKIVQAAKNLGWAGFGLEQAHDL